MISGILEFNHSKLYQVCDFIMYYKTQRIHKNRAKYNSIQWDSILYHASLYRVHKWRFSHSQTQIITNICIIELVTHSFIHTLYALRKWMCELPQNHHKVLYDVVHFHACSFTVFVFYSFSGPSLRIKMKMWTCSWKCSQVDVFVNCEQFNKIQGIKRKQKWQNGWSWKSAKDL